jgi:hypothetical protein
MKVEIMRQPSVSLEMSWDEAKKLEEMIGNTSAYQRRQVFGQETDLIGDLYFALAAVLSPD